MSDVGRAARIAPIRDLNTEALSLARSTHELRPTVMTVDPELDALLAAGCALVALGYHASVVAERFGLLGFRCLECFGVIKDDSHWRLHHLVGAVIIIL